MRADLPESTASQAQPVITTVGVVGAGLMGSGIAEVLARADLDVLLCEMSAQAAAAGRARVGASLQRGLRAGKVTEAARDRAIQRITYTHDLRHLSKADLVIEAIVEDEAAKLALFRDLDRIVGNPHAILASNTSSIPIMKLGTATNRPDRVVGVHFFNPAPVLRLVEVVPSLLTSSETERRLTDFVTMRLDKTVIRSQDRAGFVVNALLVPFLLSAVRMLEAGSATAQDIDEGLVLGCAHPMGPLRLTDLIGLDTTKAIAQSMYEEFKEPLYSAPPLLLRMVDAGLLGKKAGRGFYDYTPAAP